MIDSFRDGGRRRLFALVLPLLVAIAACGGGGSDPCTTCPPPPPETGAARLDIEFDEDARSGLETAGFKVQDLSHIDLVLTGPNGSQERTLQPAEDRVFFGDLDPGPYNVAATAFGDLDLVLFTATVDVTVVPGDTADATLEMDAQLGVVRLEVAGEDSGTVEAVAGEGVPFTVTVRNSQGRPVPGATIRLTKSTPDYGQIAFAGTTETDAQGQVTGTIDAAYSGALDLSLEVDGRPIASPGPTRVEFATGVVAANSRIVGPPTTSGATLNGIPVADGNARFEFRVVVRDAQNQPLPGVPVTPRSNRNAGLDPAVDIIEPAPGYQDGRTDQSGEYRFTVRTFTSSFLELTGEGTLRSNGGSFVPSVIEVVADGVTIDQDALTWNSTVDPGKGDFTKDKDRAQAGGGDHITLIIDARKVSQLGAGPVENGFVEIMNVLGEVINDSEHVTPAPGYDGFRTEDGILEVRMTSDEEVTFALKARIDGRTLIEPALTVIFD